MRRGLLSDDAEWKCALRDAFRSSFSPLTEILVVILAPCEPSNPSNIFNERHESFVTKLRHRFRAQLQLSDSSIALQYVLSEIQEAF